MKFIAGLKDEIEVKTTVEVDQDSGRTESYTFYTVWSTVSVTESKQLRADSQREDFDLEGEIRKKLKGWREKRGDEMEFSDDELDFMLERRETNEALTTAFLQVVFGKKALDRKNG